MGLRVASLLGKGSGGQARFFLARRALSAAVFLENELGCGAERGIFSQGGEVAASVADGFFEVNNRVRVVTTKLEAAFETK